MKSSVLDNNDDELYLSTDTLAALKEFACEKGIQLNETMDLRKEVEEALDDKQREETFTYTYGDDEIKIQLKGLRRDLGQTLQSTGLTLWRAADTLGNYIYENNSQFQNKSVLEDGDDATMELLERNCSLNGISTVNSSVKCVKLLWGEEGLKEWKLHNKEDHRFEIILGADIIYEKEYVEALFQTVSQLLEPGKDSRFILAYTKRNVYLDYVLGCATSVGLAWNAPLHDVEGIYHFYWKI